MRIVNLIAFILLGIGGINWFVIGVSGFDIVAGIFGTLSIVSRIIYILVGLSAIWLVISTIFMHERRVDYSRSV